MAFIALTPETPGTTYTAGKHWRAVDAEQTRLNFDDHEARIAALITSGSTSGDVVGPSSSVASEIALFDGTTGKSIKRATGTGVPYVASGVYSALTAASDGQVLRRSGSTVAFGAVNLASANAVTGILPVANLPTELARIYIATVTLTDAQIKALPTTPITLVPTGGVNTRIMWLGIDVQIDATAGAYTGIDADAYLTALMDTVEVSSFVVNDAGESLADLDQLLGGGKSFARLVPWSPTVVSWGALGHTWDASAMIDQALTVSIVNGSGNLTGGNVANSGRIVVPYMVIPS